MISIALEKKNPTNLRNGEIRHSHQGLLTDSLVAEHLWSHLWATKFTKKNYNGLYINPESVG